MVIGTARSAWCSPTTYFPPIVRDPAVTVALA